MLNKKQKREIIQALAKDLSEARSVVFTDYQGMGGNDIQNLRSELKKAGVDHKVAKITLLKKAMEQAGLDVSKFGFEVPLAVSISRDDEVVAAQILSKFAKGNENMEILAGILGREIIGSDQIKQLANLPSKDQLRGQVVSAIAGPLRGMVYVLSGNIRGLINVLNAKAQKS